MVTITLLGEQAVVDPDTGRILTRSARSIALLGLLVARNGAPQSRSSIAGWFWPDSGEAQAMTNLRRELHQLRQWIDDDSLEVTGSHLCWHDRGVHRVDLATFLAERDAAQASHDLREVVEHGTSALAAYTGELLPGLDGEWLEQLRDELRADCAELCDVVSAAALELELPDAAVNALRKRVALDPYDEPAHRRLIELLEESGDRAGAVRLYHRFSDTMERELGVEPDRRTVELLERITRRADRPPSPRQRRGRARSSLVGRHDELERLRRMWRRAASGRVLVALVSGAPGVGKSRLVQELATEARAQGAVTALGRCFESTGRLPLAPIADWLRTPGIAGCRSRLDPVWRAEADRLAPSSGAETLDAPGPADAWQQHRFVEGLARAVLAPERPEVLVLDNLQWCDADTLQVITSLLTLRPDAPVLLVLVARPLTGDSSAATVTWLEDLRRADLLTEVPLAPFDAAATAELAAQLRLGRAGAEGRDPGLLQEATGGFPLLIVEALRSSESPSGRRDLPAWGTILGRRLDQLSPEARATAALAAALNRDFTIPTLLHASDLDTDAVVLAVDELWRQRLVRQTEEGYDFTHDLIRTAAYETTSPPRRWLLHRRLADALQAQASARDSIAPRVAEQYALAGDHDQAVSWYLAAADAAAGVFAFAELLELMDRAVAETEHLPVGHARDEHELECRIRQVRTTISLHGYAHSDVEVTSLRIEDLAGRLDRTEDELNGINVLFGFHFVRGRMDTALEVARRGVARAQGRDHDSAYVTPQFGFAATLLHNGLCRAAYDTYSESFSLPLGDSLSSFHTRTDVFTPAWWAHAAWSCGQSEQAAELATVAIERAQAAGHVPSQAIALSYGALTAQLLGDQDLCARRSDDVVQLCDRYKMNYYGLYGRVLQAWCRGPEGAGALRATIEELKSADSLCRVPYWLALLTDLIDDRAEIEALLDEAVALIDWGHERLWLPELWRRQAALADDDAAASALLAQARDLAASQGNVVLEQRAAQDLAALSP